MRSSEAIPLWDGVTHPIANALEFASGCHHRKLSRVFTSTDTVTKFVAIVEVDFDIRSKLCQSVLTTSGFRRYRRKQDRAGRAPAI